MFKVLAYKEGKLVLESKYLTDNKALTLRDVLIKYFEFKENEVQVYNTYTGDPLC